MNNKYNNETINKMCEELGIKARIKDGQQYKNIKTKMTWINENGEEFVRDWNTLRQRKDTRKNIDENGNVINLLTKSLTPYSEIRNFIENFQGMGYQLNMTEDEYINASYGKSNHNKGSRYLNITHEELVDGWITTLENFKQSAITRVNYSSLGEIITESILKGNNLEYYTQVPVYNDKNEKTKQSIDFKVVTWNKIYFIEYDGSQHFIPSNLFGGEEELRNRKERDGFKDSYVNRVGGIMIRIPYTMTSLQDVRYVLESVMNISLDKYEIIGKLRNRKEIAEYYKNHSMHETSERYKISKSYISKSFNMIFGKSKTEMIKNDEITEHKENVIKSSERTKEIGFYYLTHTNLETKNKFNLNSKPDYVNQIFKRLTNYNKRDFITIIGGKDSELYKKILNHEINILRKC